MIAPMKKILAMLTVAVVIAGCYNDNIEELYPAPKGGGGGSTCDTATVTYAASIKPIIDSKCATGGCHDAATMGGGYNMTAYDGVKNSSARLIGAINWESGHSAMPKGMNKLDDCSIAKITKWVNEGAQNN
jgi:hypothetical protein